VGFFRPNDAVNNTISESDLIIEAAFRALFFMSLIALHEFSFVGLIFLDGKKTWKIGEILVLAQTGRALWREL
jgi:hypothetical protein